MISQVFESVWDAIEDDPEIREEMKKRTELICDIREFVNHLKMTPNEVSAITGFSTVGVSNILDRKTISSFTSEQLNYIFNKLMETV